MCTTFSSTTAPYQLRGNDVWEKGLPMLTPTAHALASLGVCALGAVALVETDGATGIGWAILGLLIIWA